MNINVINNKIFNATKLRIQVCDNKGNIIANELINKKVYFNLGFGIYVIKIYYGSNFIDSFVILHRKENDIFNIYLGCHQRNKKIFFLRDYFYHGLKIEKGEIILGA